MCRLKNCVCTVVGFSVMDTSYQISHLQHRIYWVVGENRNGAYTGSIQNLGNFCAFLSTWPETKRADGINCDKTAKNGKTFASVHESLSTL
jgi:hypothetical protein